MSHYQEANVSAQQQQQQQQQMAATDDGLSFAPISDRRGGPMDIGEPMQLQPSMMFSSPASNETLQQQQQPQSQQQMGNTGGAQYDPRTLMHPLQPQISNQSTQSSQSFQSYESVDSQQQQQNSGGGSSGGLAPLQQQQQQQQQQPFSSPPQATTSSSLTSASGHLAPPQHAHEKSRSRRWSITGRFFEKRKSITEPFHVPGAPPSSAFSSSYKSTNSNIVGCGTGGMDGKGSSSWEGPESNFGRKANGGGGNNNTSGQHHRHHGHNNNQQNNNHNNNTTTPTNGSASNSSSSALSGGTESKNTSPPGSNGSSRRSSLADLPKAILSSFRRSSIVGPGDAGSVLAAASAASMAGNGNASVGGVGGAIAEDGGELDEDGGPKVKMAVPKAPPQDPHISRPPPKSILKKRPSDVNPTAAAAAGSANSDATPSGDASATSASTAATAAGASATANTNGAVGRRGSDYEQMMSSETVHPMATADMDVKDISLLAPTDHRARLLTHSPTPTHPQQHLINKENNPILVGGAGSPLPSNNSDNVNNGVNKISSLSSQGSQGAAIPPDFTPGVQSNSYYKGRGGERSQGSVGDYMSQDELLTQQMIGISSRAQDLANQYYGSMQNSQTSRPASVPIASTASSSAGPGGRRRSINFLETVEIIPAHRKADYNRQSDKHATFKILTPDMKSEIRDELNTYKMREMAVHVESMANTAFH
ncbi:hypothetical protein BGZ95_003699 [Linnemannia exigua]|uniref:Uncharacterized protein n=1 Tax=Linnemannia exigua TaxID=604196 RepID=A0AAD4DHT4_9FUNG|nr:hypothetical protein BGZ95_003699 [Linnemannia exigua]